MTWHNIRIYSKFKHQFPTYLQILCEITKNIFVFNLAHIHQNYIHNVCKISYTLPRAGHPENKIWTNFICPSITRNYLIFQFTWNKNIIIGNEEIKIGPIKIGV